MSSWFCQQPIRMPWLRTAMGGKRTWGLDKTTAVQVLPLVPRQPARRPSVLKHSPVRAPWAAVAACVTLLAMTPAAATDFFADVERDRVHDAMNLGNYQGALDLVEGYTREFDQMR